MRIHTITSALLALSLAAAPAVAQVASAVLIEGEELPGGPVGHVVDSINNSGVNHAGGIAFTVNSSDGVDTISHVWGLADGELAGMPLISEGTYGDYQQYSFESFFGIDDAGRAAYSPMCNDTGSGGTSLDSVWLGDMPIAMEEVPYPHEPGYWWSFASRPGVTADGTPYFVGGITDTQGGSTDIRGFFYGNTTTPLVLGGDVIPWPNLPVTAAGIDFDARVSALGTHWICPVNLDTGSTTNDGYILIDGAVATAGGSAVREDGPVPAAAGGLPGELWDNFDFCGINEAGDWLLTGDTNAAVGQDEFVMLNGAIVLREGTLLDGNPINGSIEGAYLNEDGDWAVIWDMDYGPANLEVLIQNGRVLLREGSAVDFDGDGVVEPTSLLADFTGISALTLGDRDDQGVVKVCFTADVDTPIGRRVPQDGPVGDLDEAGLDEPPALRDGRALLEGAFVMETSAVTGADPVPSGGIALAPNHPNPFNPATTIAFTMAAAGEATLDVLTVDGRHVATLLHGVRAAGEHRVVWRGCDDAGRAQPSGVYLYRLRAGGLEESRSMVLLR
jgi:hypothetical protein